MDTTACLHVLEERRIESWVVQPVAHVLRNPSLYYHGEEIKWKIYKVVQIWPGQTVSCLHTNRPGHIWTTLYLIVTGVNALKSYRCENDI